MNDTCKSKQHYDENGFTLIEVLIALFVLTIGILGMMVMQTTAIQGNARASSLTIASTLAGDQVEILRNTPFDDLVNGTRTDIPTGYDITWTVAAAADPNARLLTVTVVRNNDMPDVTFTYIKADLL